MFAGLAMELCEGNAVCSTPMRVIAGQFRSRVLQAPPGTGTRPTSDRLRETLFNILGERVRQANFADLYAGSGAVGVEALSRGARAAHFVEKAAPPLVALRKNLAALGLQAQGTVDGRPVHRALEDKAKTVGGWDLVFLDPPYDAVEEYTATLSLLARHATRLLAPDALVVAEHANRYALPEQFGTLVRQRLLRQGDAALSFYSLPEPLTR